MSSASLSKTLSDIAKALVEKPEAVSVEQRDEEECIRLVLHVDENDMGKIIGKQGKIAKAIRTLMKATSGRESIRVYVDIE